MLRKFIARLMAIFFELLYNQFASLYDSVAYLVSFGNWKKWVYSIEELLEPIETLELGIGPGHLQSRLLQKQYPIFGIDISRNMTRMSHRRIMGFRNIPQLAQASSLAIPFPSQSFHQVISTFPSEYILQQSTLSEISRVLKPQGKLIVVLGVQITGKSIPHKIMNLIYKITGQSANLPTETISEITELFAKYDLDIHVNSIDRDFYSLFFIVAQIFSG